MQTLKKVSVITCFLLSLFLVSCDRNNSTTNAINQAQVTTTIQSGNWKVTYFTDNGVDRTTSFSGYQFVFNTSGTATATKNTTITNGTWAAGTDDSKVKLILFFGNSSPLDDLNEDWHVIERTDTRIKLEHISGGNGGIQYATFEKN